LLTKVDFFDGFPKFILFFCGYINWFWERPVDIQFFKGVSNRLQDSKSSPDRAGNPFSGWRGNAVKAHSILKKIEVKAGLLLKRTAKLYASKTKLRLL